MIMYKLFKIELTKGLSIVVNPTVFGKIKVLKKIFSVIKN